LSGDRLSCITYVANAFRLLLHAFAYRLLDELRIHIAAVAPALGRARFDTIRLRLLKRANHDNFSRFCARGRARFKRPSSRPEVAAPRHDGAFSQPRSSRE